MSDTLLVAMTTGLFALMGIVLTHHLSREDRMLASNVASTKDAELDALREAHAREVAQLNSTIVWLRDQLDRRGVTA